MTRAPEILHTADQHATAPRVNFDYRIAAAATAAAIIAGFLTAAVWTRIPAAADVHHAGVASAVPAVSGASDGTSVPEAGSIFNGAESTAEEPSPTF